MSSKIICDNQIKISTKNLYTTISFQNKSSNISNKNLKYGGY